METQTGEKIKKLRSDNRGKYSYDPFLKVCREEGIVRHFTVRRTPQQNGVEDRMNRTLVTKVRCMLSHAGWSKAFWAEAVIYASYLVNRLHVVGIGRKMPMEVWSGKPVTDYDCLHVFGCSTYFHVTESKLDHRAKKAIFLDFSSGTRAYSLWCPELKKIILSRDVTFDESGMLHSEKENLSPISIQQVELESQVMPTKTVQKFNIPDKESDDVDLTCK